MPICVSGALIFHGQVLSGVFFFLFIYAHAADHGWVQAGRAHRLKKKYRDIAWIGAEKVEAEESCQASWLWFMVISAV